MGVSSNSLRYPLVALVLGACAVFAQAAADAGDAAKPRPVTLTQFFVTPDAPTTLVWTSGKGSTTGEVECRLTDYWGKPVSAAGPATQEVDGTLRLPVRLQPGFYEISFPQSGAHFGVMAAPAHAGEADPFFGMDSVLSWLELRPTVREQFVQILKRCGIAISRERTGWGHINPAPDKWEWNAVDQYETLRQAYARQGVPILEMFHHSPRWARSSTPTLPYPENLVTAAQCWNTVAARWRQYWAGLEIWNEPEGSACGNWSAEQYIPTIKALAYGFAQAKYDFPIGGGSFMGEDPGDYHNTCALNGMLEQVDFVSFHTYHGAADIERHVGRYRQWLKSWGKEAMPLWITESGESWPVGTDRAVQADDARSAVQIAMKAVEARACGVARYFPFDLPFYVEGPRNFGMMGRDGSPLRSMAAYAQCVAMLSGKTYVGDLKVASPARRARVFSDGGDGRVAVIYTGMPESSASIRLDAAVDLIEGADGRVLERRADGSIPVPDGMVYLHGKAAAFAGLLETNTQAARLLAISQQPAPRRAAPSPLVMQFIPEGVPALHGPDGYLLQASAAGALPIRVRAWNLSSEPLAASLSLELPGKQQRLSAAAVTIPPRQSAEVNWTVDARESLDIEEFRHVSVSGAAGAAGDARLAIPLRLEGTLEQYMERRPVRTRVGIDDLSKWEKNIAPHGQMSFASAGEGQWRMELSFSQKTDEWVYPKFRMPKLAAGTVRGVLLRARAAEAGGVRLMVFKGGAGTYWTSQPIIPADGKWHAAWIPVEKFDPLSDINNVGSMELADADQLSIGMHNQSPTNANVLEVSDFYLVGEGPGQASVK